MLRNFYVIMVVAFSMLSGFIIGIIWLFYKHPEFNLTIASSNDISILLLNTILVILGICTSIGIIVYYRGATKEKEELPINEMMPNNDDLLIVKNIDYICAECKKIISGYEICYQKMPKDFNIEGLSKESEIPKCPHCGTLAFFGMAEAKE